MKPIIQDGDPVLRRVSKDVAKEEFNTPELALLIQDMADALQKEPDGVAIAAPQIGVAKRIFLARYDRMLPPREAEEPARAPDIGVFINPEILKTSRKRTEADEGCLSVRGRYGTTRRYEQVTVRAFDEHGTRFTRGGGGLLAQAFQHEIDHLNGILFIDHATDVYETKTSEHA